MGLAAERQELRPQAGSQERFLVSDADIAVYGGHAFSGKTFALLMEALYDAGNKKFTATIFRRTYPQIMAQGGLWDTAEEMYVPLGGRPRLGHHEWVLPGAGRVRFAHLDRDAELANWQGTQIDYIGMDQLEQFSERQFFFMQRSNRSMSGARARMRGTCNPDPDSFLRTFMEWWIDDDTGLAIPERSGVRRYFAKDGEDVTWGDTKQQVIDELGPDADPKSFTFVLGRITDNPIGLEKNPGYIASLKALPYVDRRRLLEGDWNIRASAGNVLRREWFNITDNLPVFADVVRVWDRAATDEAEASAKTASWTAGAKIGMTEEEKWFLLDMRRFKKSGNEVKQAIKTVAEADGPDCRIGLFQDPGAAGKSEGQDMVRFLAGYDVELLPTMKPGSRKTDIVVAETIERNAKVTYAKPWARQVEAGNFLLYRAPWNEIFLREAANFDGTGVCDQCDAVSGGFELLTNYKEAGVW